MVDFDAVLARINEADERAKEEIENYAKAVTVKSMAEQRIEYKRAIEEALQNGQEIPQHIFDGYNSLIKDLEGYTAFNAENVGSEQIKTVLKDYSQKASDFIRGGLARLTDGLKRSNERFRELIGKGVSSGRNAASRMAEARKEAYGNFYRFAESNRRGMLKGLIEREKALQNSLEKQLDKGLASQKRHNDIRNAFGNLISTIRGKEPAAPKEEKDELRVRAVKKLLEDSKQRVAAHEASIEKSQKKEAEMTVSKENEKEAEKPDAAVPKEPAGTETGEKPHSAAELFKDMNASAEEREAVRNIDPDRLKSSTFEFRKTDRPGEAPEAAVPDEDSRQPDGGEGVKDSAPAASEKKDPEGTAQTAPADKAAAKPADKEDMEFAGYKLDFDISRPRKGEKYNSRQESMASYIQDGARQTARTGKDFKVHLYKKTGERLDLTVSRDSRYNVVFTTSDGRNYTPDQIRNVITSMNKTDLNNALKEAGVRTSKETKAKPARPVPDHADR